VSSAAVKCKSLRRYASYGTTRQDIVDACGGVARIQLATVAFSAARAQRRESIGRMLRSLYVLGEPGAASALFEALAGIYDEERRSGQMAISDRTFQFWSSAIER
jgi:hypothetical protein